MNCFGCAADFMNSALLTFKACMLTSLTYRAAQLLRLERNGRLERRFFFGRADKDELEYRIYVLGSQEAELTADGLVDILKVALVVCRDDDGLDPGAQRAMVFSRSPPIGRTRPRRVISPVMATSRRAGRPDSAEMSATVTVMPADGRPSGQRPPGSGYGYPCFYRNPDRCRALSRGCGYR